MSEWKKVKLGEICEFINGGSWSDKEYTPQGIPVLKVTNCKPSGFDLSNISYLPIAASKKYSKNKLQKGDIIIATVGSHPNLVNSAAGRSNIVTTDVEGFYLNQNAVCVRVKNDSLLDQTYLGYYTRTREFQHYIQNRGKGAANQMRIAISAIKEYTIPLIPLETQCVIGRLLSTYDQLISNYYHQIKLLEEAAQRLYKEWFVDLHFPGYENTKIVDGVPEGWRKGTLSSISEFRRGKTITKKEIKEGTVPVVAGGLTPAYYTNTSNTGNRVITISASGANAGYTRLYYQNIWASDCSFVDASMTKYLYYVYCFLKVNKSLIDNLQKGAAQPHVYPKDINALEIIIPSQKILDSTEEILSSMFEEISQIDAQIHLLIEARDRLLPKLMSGEIEV